MAELLDVFFEFQGKVDAVMNDIAAAAGMQPSVIVFLISLICCLPNALVLLAMPHGFMKHFYGGLSGLIICWTSFGTKSLPALTVPVLLSYLIIVLIPKKAGMIVVALNFTYLILQHTLLSSEQVWKEGGMDHTGALMVLVLKLSSAAFAVQDGFLDENNADKPLRPFQKEKRLKSIPNPLEFFGYIYCAGSASVGPQYEIKDYLDWARGSGPWANKKMPSTILPGLYSFAQAVICAGIHVYMQGAGFVLSFFDTPEYAAKNVVERLVFIYLLGVQTRFKYYFVWSFAESTMRFIGIAYETDKEGKTQWTRTEQMRIEHVELATSSADMVNFWNMGTNKWLRYYCYERIPGKFNLAFTQITSSVWHGLNSGYFMMFGTSVFFVEAGRIVFKFGKTLSQPLQLPWKALMWVFWQVQLNYMAMPFIIVALEKSLYVWGSVYYIPHILLAVIIVSDKLFGKKEKKADKDGAKKEEKKKDQ